MSAVTGERAASRSLASSLTSPLGVLGATMLVLPVLLTLPVVLPIGPFYWDLFIYFDAANRIASGQIPSVDFFAPVGPLSYWLFALGVDLFPNAQPLLLVNWSLFLVTAPLMALVLWDTSKHSRGIAFALLVPFLVFHILPINVEQYSSFPSTDGFGIYNRQVSHLLYVLVAGLVFCRSQRLLFALISASCLALFLTKVTGFAAAGMICAFAFAAGRVTFATATACVLAFAAALAAVELSTGAILAYLDDIFALVRINEGSLLPRFLQAASIHFGTFASGSLLACALLVLGWKAMRKDLHSLRQSPSLAELQAFFDRDAFWLGAALFAGLFFETQNTGGQAFIFVWPAVLRVLVGSHLYAGRSFVLILTLAAATALPPFVTVVHKAARALVGQIRYVELDSTHLGTLGFVTQRPEVMQRADDMIDIYADHAATYQAFSDRDMLPNFTLYAELDFQIAWLKAVDEAVSAIDAYEIRNVVRFDTIMNLNFVNPFPWLMDREAPRHIAIGADPFRAVPKPDSKTLAAVRATDLVLYPTCPITSANSALWDFYKSALSGHERVTLSRCWQGYIKR